MTQVRLIMLIFLLEPLVFGNWLFYAYAVENDIAVTRDDSVGFLTGTTYFRLDLSFSGAPMFPRAFSTLKATTT